MAVIECTMKRSTSKISSALMGAMLLAWLILSGSNTLAAQDLLEVFVSIPPQAYLVDQVGGTHVRVHTLSEKGQDPHSFEPTPKQVLSLGNADLFFTMGLPFEQRLLGKIKGSSPTLSVVDISSGITKRVMQEEFHGAESHDEEERHRGEPDPHIWLAPPLVKIMAQNIAQALIQADPDHTAAFQLNLAAFERDLEILHRRIKKILKPLQGQAFYVYHAAFGYFGDTYGLEQRAVESAGKKPTPKYLSRLIGQAQTEKVRIIFVQPQFDKTSAQTIARAINGAVVEIDTLAYNVLDNLDHMATKIEHSLAAKPLPEQLGN